MRSQLMVAGIMAAMSLPGAACAQQRSGRGQMGAGIQNGAEGQSGQGVPLAPARPADGSFSILAPAGWNLSQIPGADFAFAVAPPSADGTGIYMLAIRISDERYSMAINRCSQAYQRNAFFAPNLTECVIGAVQNQLQDSSHTWSAEDSLRDTLQMLSGAGARFELSRASNVSDKELQYAVDATVNGRAMVHWGEVVMFYVPNALLGSGGRPGVTSVALIKGCHAPKGREEAFRATCSGVLQSFRPEQEWEARLASQLVETYNQEAQILMKFATTILGGMQAAQARIAQWGDSMKQMQMRTYEEYRKSNLISGQNAIAALGNEVNMKDPVTGQPVAFPVNSGPYCRDSAGNYVYGAAAARDCARKMLPYQYPDVQ
jgi:hypothetical protein